MQRDQGCWAGRYRGDSRHRRVSLFTLQRAKSAGARAIATTFSDVKAKRLMGLGADGGAAGIVTVRFRLDRRGGVRASEIVASSGARTMDQAALSQLKEVTPFPRPPATAPWRTRDFTDRLDFRAL